MSERLTAIMLPGIAGSGLVEWGRKTVPDMIAIYRALAKRQKEKAEAILAAADSDFYVDTYLGPYAMRNREILQYGRKLRSSCDVCGATDRPTATVIAYGIETNACDKCRGVEEEG